MFGKAIICPDAAADAARYGFTAVDMPEGFLVPVVVSLGENICEVCTAPEDTDELEEKKMGVKGLGRKKTDKAKHLSWKDDVKVSCGSLVDSGYKDIPLEYNEYVVYDPKMDDEVSRNVHGNKLTGTIPRALDKLKWMTYLNLSSNSVSGPIPIELSKAGDLDIVNLSNNYIYGYIPPEFGNLRSIMEIDFAANEHSGVIPQELSLLQNLMILNVSYNNLAGDIPSANNFI